MTKATSAGAGRKLAILLGSVLTILVLSLALPLTGLLLPGEGQAIAQQASDQAIDKGFDSKTNPRSDFWRAVREGNEGYSAVKGIDSGMLINNGGENFREVRNGPVSYYGWIVMAVMLGLIVLFHLYSMASGNTRLHEGRSGVEVKRWDAFTRFLHWVTAITFILLAATGLSLLYGRAVMIPMIGKDAFAAWAGVAKLIHNYAGPVFGVTLTLLLLMLLPHNIPNGHDIKWFLKGGGLLSKSSHPPAGRMNGGEKAWYWLLATVGMAVVVTGVLMIFVLDLTREQSQMALTIHAIGSLVVTAVALGHIYIGTAGTEGSLEAMTTGKVDLNWAKQHHDLWVEDLERKGKLKA